MRKTTTTIIVVLVLAAIGFFLGRLTGGEQALIGGINAAKRVLKQLPAPPRSDAIVGDAAGGEAAGPETASGDLVLEIPGDGAAVGTSFEVAGRVRMKFVRVAVSVRDAAGETIFSDTAGIEPGEQYGRFGLTVGLASLPAGGGTVEIAALAADGSRSEAISRQVVFTASDTVSFKAFFGSRDDGGTDCSVVRPVERRLTGLSQLYRQALEELLKGPTAEETKAGYFTSLPSGVVLKSVAADADGVVAADFTSSLERGVGGSCRVIAIRSQITETLKQFPEVREVVISVNGRTEDILQP